MSGVRFPAAAAAEAALERCEAAVAATAGFAIVDGAAAGGTAGNADWEGREGMRNGIRILLF